MKKFLFMLVACCMSLQIYAQNTPVNGRVVDNAGVPLIGATIKLKGGSAGVSTNNDGRFSMSVPLGSTLTISYLGFVNKEIQVTANNARDLNIILTEADTSLDEIVVVGYGTQTKGTVTGAVSSVSGTDMQRSTNNDVTNSLTGRAPGVRVTQITSQPGKYDSQLDVRGFSGIDNNVDNIDGALTVGGPLIIVDGVQRDKSGFDRLDPNEIESVTVLKDATAAVYGVQAANGVILVTTRKGQAGKVQVTYNARFGEQVITKYPELSNAYEYATLYNEEEVNRLISGRQLYTPPRFTADQIEKYRTGELPSTDYLRMVLATRTPQQQHNINISGGTDKLKFFTSAGYFNEQGLYTTGIDWGKKYNLRANVDAELTKGLTMNINLGLINSLSKGQNGATWAFLKNTWRMDPTETPFANSDPNYPKVFELGNPHPLADITESLSGYTTVDDKFLTSTFDFKYTIAQVKGLMARAQFALDNNYGVDKTFNKKYDQYRYLFNAATNSYYYDPVSYQGVSQLQEPFRQGSRKFMQFSLNYNRRFGKHNVSAAGFFERNQRKSSGHNTLTQYVIDAVDQLAAGIRASDKVNSSFDERATMSYIGKTTYDFAGKYMGEFGFRYDGSSRFPKDSRWGFFPYVAAGWRISEEPFIKNNVSFLNNLKLRASYGILGDDGASNYQWLTGYTYPGGNNRGAQFGTGAGSFVTGVDFKNSPNPNITWYTSTTTNIGLDASLWKGLLSATVEVFRRDRDGLLAFRNSSVPDTYGVTLPQVNLNEDRTQGFEIELSHRNRIGQVTYTISPNMSYARTLNRSREELPTTSDYDQWRNRSKYRYNDVVFGYKTAGQFQNFAEIAAWPVIDNNGNRSLLPGDIKLVDLNGDGVVDPMDQTVIGRGGSKPAVYFATNLGVDWKGFDFALLFQGATMYQAEYNDQLSRPFAFPGANPITTYLDRWHRENVFDMNSAWIPGRWPSTGQRAKQYDRSEFRRFDATYMRIKSLDIGYTLPKALLSKIHVSKLRVYANAYNLHTWNFGGLDFVDPEFTDDRLYGYNYPLTMNFNLGVQLGL